MPFASREERNAALKTALREDEVFVAAVHARTNQLLRRRVARPVVQEEITRMLEAHQTWKTAYSLYDQGKGLAEIGRIIRLDPEVIRNWIARGSRPNEIAIPLRAEGSIRKLRLPLNPDTAFLTGLFMTGHLHHGGTHNTLSFHGANPFAHEIMVIADRLRIPHSTLTEGRADVNKLYSVAAVDALERITRRRKGVPLEFFDSSEKVRQYLRALVFSGGNFEARGRYSINLNNRLLSSVPLFTRIGLFPRIFINRAQDRCTLDFRGPDLDKLIASGIMLPEHERIARERRQEYLKEDHRNTYDLDQIEAALGMGYAVLRIAPKDVEKRTGVKVSSFRQWGANKAPPAAQRLAEHVKFAEEVLGVSAAHLVDRWPLAFTLGLKAVERKLGAQPSRTKPFSPTKK